LISSSGVSITRCCTTAWQTSIRSNGSLCRTGSRVRYRVASSSSERESMSCCFRCVGINFAGASGSGSLPRVFNGDLPSRNRAQIDLVLGIFEQLPRVVGELRSANHGPFSRLFAVKRVHQFRWQRFTKRTRHLELSFRQAERTFGMPLSRQRANFRNRYVALA